MMLPTLLDRDWGTMSTKADQAIAALRSGHDDLAALVRGLTPDDLIRPSAASEWQVSQVLSHLGSGAEIGLSSLTTAQTGAPGPDGDFNRKVWDRWDAMPPAEHASEFLISNERLVEAYEALTPTAREELRINLGFLPEPIDVDAAGRFRLNEFSLHQWDVAVTFDPAAGLAAEAVPLLLDVESFMFGWLAKSDPLAGREGVLAVQLNHPDRSFGLAFGPQVALVETPDQPDGELTLPAEAWERLVTGRLGRPYTPDSVRVTGPLTLDDLRAVFPGF
jgi:uncharacterized protein (TIGR03083 family)